MKAGWRRPMAATAACLALMGTPVQAAPLEDDGHPGHSSATQMEASALVAEDLFRTGESYAEAKDWFSARYWYERAAKRGHAEAQFTLGNIYEQGAIGVPQDYEAARKWYGKAAAQGHAHAQNSLGLMHYYGRGGPKDYAQARYWYEKAALQGNAYAQYNLGVLRERGRGISKDLRAARGWYEKAAAQGNALAQNNLALMYANGKGVMQDYAKAAGLWKQAAAQGDAQAQINLGILHAEGHGVRQDWKTARSWWEKAAAQGNTDAMRYLGDLHERGLGVKPDAAKALEWYWMACGGEDQDGCRELERLAGSHGLTVPTFRPASEGRTFIVNTLEDFLRLEASGVRLQETFFADMEAFAKAGSPEHQAIMGWCLITGTGMNKEPAAARHWLEAAASRGIGSAQRMLGVMHYSGEGAPKSRRKAEEWLAKAAARGDASAKVLLAAMHGDEKPEKPEGEAPASSSAMNAAEKTASAAARVAKGTKPAPASEAPKEAGREASASVSTPPAPKLEETAQQEGSPKPSAMNSTGRPASDSGTPAEAPLQDPVPETRRPKSFLGLGMQELLIALGVPVLLWLFGPRRRNPEPSGKGRPGASAEARGKAQKNGRRPDLLEKLAGAGVRCPRCGDAGFAFADTPRELRCTACGCVFNLEEALAKAFRKWTRAKSAREAFAVFGLEPGASMEEVKRRRLELLKRFHPDHHAGGGKEARDAAEATMRVNRAYDVLKEYFAEEGTDRAGADAGGAAPSTFGDLRKEAAAGSAEAQHRLACLFAEGAGGAPKNEAAAREWFMKAGDQGHAQAQRCLGSMFLAGRGGPRDLLSARAWFEKAARQGDAKAMMNLSLMAERGVCFVRDPGLASRLRQAACLAGGREEMESYRRRLEAWLNGQRL